MSARTRLSLFLAVAALIVAVSLGASHALRPQDGGSSPDAATIHALVGVARDLVNGRNAALLEQPAATAAGGFVPSFGRASPQMLAAERAARAELSQRRLLLAELGERYTSASSAVVLVGFGVTGNRLTLRVSEHTRMTYIKLRGNEPSYTEWVAERVLEFRWDDSAWVLESAALGENTPVPPLNEPTGAGL